MSQHEYELRTAEYRDAYEKKRIEYDGKISDLTKKVYTLKRAVSAFGDEIRTYNEQIEALKLDKSNAKLSFRNECANLRNSFNIVTQANMSIDCFSSTQKHHLTKSVEAAVKRALKDFDNVAHNGIYCEYYTNEEGRIAFDVTVPKK